MRTSRFLLSSLLSLLGAGGCDAGEGDSSPDDDTDADSDVDTDVDTDTDSDVSIGRIAVVERYRQDHDSREGVVSIWGPLDAAWEEGIVGDWVFGCGDTTGDVGVWRVARTEGDCQLVVLDPCSADCDPPCSFDTYCLDDGTCADAPRFADAGTLTLEGLAVPVSIEPATHRYPELWGLPEDLFDPGDPVALQASGGALAGFEAESTGVSPLDATLPCEDVPEAGKDLVLQWTPSGVPGARIRWEMTQDVHLFQGPRIRCETQDVGSLILPADLVDAYLHGKMHTLTLTRYTLDLAEVPGAGRIAFEVGASVSCIIHEGHTPWSKPRAPGR